MNKKGCDRKMRLYYNVHIITKKGGEKMKRPFEEIPLGKEAEEVGRLGEEKRLAKEMDRAANNIAIMVSEEISLIFKTLIAYIAVSMLYNVACLFMLVSIVSKL